MYLAAELACANPTRPAIASLEERQAVKFSQIPKNQRVLSLQRPVLFPSEPKVRDFEPLFDRPISASTTVNWTWKRLNPKLIKGLRVAKGAPCLRKANGQVKGVNNAIPTIQPLNWFSPARRWRPPPSTLSH